MSERRTEDRTPRPSRWRRWRRRLLLMFGSLTVAAVATEFALWLVDAFPPRPRYHVGEFDDGSHPNFVADAELGWRTRPDLATVVNDEGGEIPVFANADGQRAAAAGRRTHEHTRTIVLAGDSFVWGVGVRYEDSLAGRLERAIPGLRVVNVAQPAYGVDQIVLAVEHRGFAPKPDLLIVGLYPMDFGRSLTAFRDDFGFNKPTFTLRDGEPRRLTAADRPGLLWRWLEHHSRLLGIWRRAQRTLGFRFGIGDWWTLNEALLDRLLAAATAANVPVLFVHVPMPDWRTFPPLLDYCERRSVPLVDPQRGRATRPAGMYFPPAGHWTPAGHERVSGMVLDWIREHGPERLR